ncbi:MAG TPA: hypothetical protein VJH20_06045 [Candidatus Nanoarchaeia archaeon]|nr:hypothetical protein [Candidatus Nanoarchaeia archaeon]
MRKILLVTLISIIIISGCQSGLTDDKGPSDTTPGQSTTENTPESINDEINILDKEISDEDLEDIDVIIDENTF